MLGPKNSIIQNDNDLLDELIKFYSLAWLQTRFDETLSKMTRLKARNERVHEVVKVGKANVQG